MLRPLAFDKSPMGGRLATLLGREHTMYHTSLILHLKLYQSCCKRILLCSDASVKSLVTVTKIVGPLHTQSNSYRAASSHCWCWRNSGGRATSCTPAGGSTGYTAAIPANPSPDGQLSKVLHVHFFSHTRLKRCCRLCTHYA